MLTPLQCPHTHPIAFNSLLELHSAHTKTCLHHITIAYLTAARTWIGAMCLPQWFHWGIRYQYDWLWRFSHGLGTTPQYTSMTSLVWLRDVFINFRFTAVFGTSTLMGNIFSYLINGSTSTTSLLTDYFYTFEGLYIPGKQYFSIFYIQLVILCPLLVHKCIP